MSRTASETGIFKLQGETELLRRLLDPEQFQAKILEEVRKETAPKEDD